MTIAGKAKREYLKSPVHCPFCGSENLEASGLEVDDWDEYLAHFHVQCLSCKKAWRDEYKLVDVEEVEVG